MSNSVVAGDMRAMLWKGGGRRPRFWGERGRGRPRSKAAGGAGWQAFRGLGFPGGGGAAGHGADGVSLVGDKKGAVTASKFSGGGPVAVVGEDDADVGHGGLRENASDVVMLEGSFESVEIVKFDDAGGFGGIDGRADIAAAGADYAVFERGEGFIYRAVVAIVEDENFCALGDFARDANGETIGVGRREGELPVGEAEAGLEIFADPDGVFGGKQQRGPFLGRAGGAF